MVKEKTFEEVFKKRNKMKMTCKKCIHYFFCKKTDDFNNMICAGYKTGLPDEGVIVKIGNKYYVNNTEITLAIKQIIKEVKEKYSKKVNKNV